MDDNAYLIQRISATAEYLQRDVELSTTENFCVSAELSEAIDEIETLRRWNKNQRDTLANRYEEIEEEILGREWTKLTAERDKLLADAERYWWNRLVPPTATPLPDQKEA